MYVYAYNINCIPMKILKDCECKNRAEDALSELVYL